ncbi:citrate lyase subunit alpha [Candidatus Heimdallarchaeota archaeon B3_Heim]|nr:MAG: citrate lyase subunit alpha [Candidatus Heimdallarchaeota archaeon B3_Heim]
MTTDITNILGRKFPEKVFNRVLKPYKGIHNSTIAGTRVGTAYQPTYVSRKTKRFFDSVEALLDVLPLRNGMSISFHHALRNGDNIVLPIVEALASYGINNITLATTALFPVHTPLIEFIQSGVIGRIEGSVNGPLGNAISREEVKVPTILRSHGGRTRAVQEGSLPVDVTFIAASACDFIGNLTGMIGKNAFGSLGYPLETDSLYANIVVGVTDTVINEPLVHVSIPSSRVDYVLEVDKIGDPEKIASGSLGRKPSPQRLGIAETVVQVMEHSGYLNDGFNWQAGAGGMSLAASQYLKELMADKNIHGGYIFGGIATNSVKMLEEGLFTAIYDAQSFDLGAIESLHRNENHVEISIDHAYNPFNKACIALNTDFTVLGATEIDLNFNVNVNTFSNGLLNSGIGGHQDAARAKVSMIVVPVARKVPSILDSVTTVSTPGDSIDLIITDGGIALNPHPTPKRLRIEKRLRKAKLNLRTINELKEESHSIVSPISPEFTSDITTLVEYRDGTYLDVIYSITD